MAVIGQDFTKEQGKNNKALDTGSVWTVVKKIATGSCSVVGLGLKNTAFVTMRVVDDRV